MKLSIPTLKQEKFIEVEENEHRIFCINLSVNRMSSILYSRMNPDQIIHYDALMETRGMQFYFLQPFADIDRTAYVTSGLGYRVHPITELWLLCCD